MLDQQAKTLPELLSKQGGIRLIRQGHLVFLSKLATEGVFISWGILQHKDLIEIYKLPETETASILEKLLDDFKKLDSEEALETRNFCLGVTALNLSYHEDIRKELLKLLTGFFPNVQKITIGVTGFVSKRGEIYISPLAELKALEELTIRGCNVRDVALVPSNLQRLELHNCEAENIDGLVKSKQLKKLKLSSMKITTLEVPLGIQNLELTQCQEIRNFNVLPNLVELKELHLSASRFKDLSLVPCDSLKRLTLDCYEIKEYSGLAKLTKLEWLKLSISDATDLPHLPLTIEHLELSGYQVTNFSSLASLTKLRFLSLGNLEIDDLSLIPSSVETLIISDCTNAKDFTPLNNLLELKNLRLGIPEYEEPKLDISGTSTEHRNLNSLSKLLMLKTLTLTGGTAINGLSELPDSLESLMLRGTKWGGTGYTRLTNFSNITELPNLKKLILNCINNLPPLPTSLTELEIWNGFEDTESLASLANAQKLERLVLVRVDIKDLSVLPKSLKELTLAQCEHIEFCPKWLKEKIRKGEIIIKDHDIKSLLIKPSPPPKQDPNPLPLEELPFPILFSIFQKLPLQDQANLKLASKRIQPFNMSHISFSANLEIVNFLSYHKALEPETFNKLYTQALGLAVDDVKIYEEPGLPLESHLKLYSNFDAIKSLDLSKFVVKKDLLEILIELCPNVKNIALGNIDSNLAGELERWPLKELKKLYINSCTQLTNLDFLSNLTELKVLSLAYSGQAVLSSVPKGVEELSLYQFNIAASANKLFAQLIRLKKLNLIYTDIADLSVLPTSLEELRLFSCKKVKNFGSLARLTSLKKLDLSQTEIDDISILPTSLKDLNLSSCSYIKSLTPLTSLKSLEKLDLYSSKIEDLSVLPNSLKELNLAHCPDIKYCPEWLKEKIRKEEIVIRNYDVESLLDIPISPHSSLEPQQESGGLAASAAYTFKASETCNLSYKNYISLLGLATNLKALILHHCNIGDFAHIANLQELRKLDLSHTNIEDLAVLPPSLKELLLMECKNIADFARLANLQELEKLDLSSAKIANLSVLPTSLIELDLWKCQDIEDFAPLIRLEKLEKLKLSWTKIQDLSVLPANLKEVYLLQCNDIEFCPDSLKEKIKKKEIIIKGCSAEKLLAMPSSTLEEQETSTLITSPELTSSPRNMLNI